MKKIILLILLPLLGLAQSKVSNTVSVSGISAAILLNNSTQTATLTIVGPADRWLACQFGSFSGGMEAGSDVVYYNGATLVDATHGGIGVTPTADVQNNWTVTSNSVNTGTRTIVATRPFNSTDTSDYDFVYTNTSIGIAVAQGNSASFVLAYHGADNRIFNTSVPFTTLGIEDFSLNAAKVYPNPSKGFFTIESSQIIERVTVYTQTGVFVKTVSVANNGEIIVLGLATGVYLLELKTARENVWKKIIID